MVKQMQGKQAHKRFLLDKSFDRVPKEAMRWATRKSGVKEWLEKL